MINKLNTIVLRIKAYIGIPSAMFRLGNNYLYGNGVTTNIEKGYECLKKSANKGFGPAVDALKQAFEDDGNSMQLKGDFFPKAKEIIYPHQLTIDRSPRAVYFDDTAEQALLSGGWGYDKDSAVAILVDNDTYGVEIEYKFIHYRAIKELNGHPESGAYQGITCGNVKQKLMKPLNGKVYDVLNYVVTALPVKDWEWLKNDWEAHNAYENDEEGRKQHLSMMNERIISYETICFFDITAFFGK